MRNTARLFSSFLSLAPQQPLGGANGIANGSPSQQPLEPIKAGLNFNCLPTQSCWPSKDDWRGLNATLNGRLRATDPWAHPCYIDRDSVACAQIEKDYGIAESRESVYGAMQNLKWETCGTQNCQLNSLAPGSNLSGTCDLGRVSAYYVNATEASHVVATINFIRKHRVRLSIKNTGHDYFGRSSAANSLALWTHNMNQLEFRESFTLSNCPSSRKLQNIGIMGAGTVAGDAYTFFERFGMQITVGAAASVGVSGGFGQAGGHGPLAPTYGLMVDQAVEFDVVTADGKLRTINQCNDPELFWAMRGGGGGTFGVHVAYKLQLHPAMPLNVHLVEALIPFNETTSQDVSKSQSHRDIAIALALNQQQWSKNGIAGYNFFFPNKFISILIHPGQDKKALMSLTAQWAAFLSSYPGLHVAAEGYLNFPNYTQFATWTNSPEIAKNGLIGVGIAESSRLVPQSQFSSFSAINELVDAFLQGLQVSLQRGAGLSSGVGQIYATTPANTPDADGSTSINPAWRDSLWHVVYPGMYLNNYTQTQQDSIFDTVSAAIEPLKNLLPDSGAYFNEGDWKEPDWQKTFFGSNYDNLLSVKQKYDPEGLFSCWKCVGWVDNDDPIDSCYGVSDKEPIPSVPLPSL